MDLTKEQRDAYQEKKRESDRKYRESHKEQIKATHKAWREKNRDRLNEKARERYKKNPSMYKEIKDRYVASHADKVKAARKRYNTENRERRSAYEKMKRHTDPVYRFRSSVSCLIRGYARRKGYAKNKTIWELIGCDFEAFLSHIQSQFEDGMTLENYGNGKGRWSIDHIVPISAAQTDEDVERVNHYTNLRPMWSIDNSKKSRKMS